jgi:hypothetical protein
MTMDEIIFMYVYDKSSNHQEIKIKGLTTINIEKNVGLIKKLENKQIHLSDLPVLVIMYKHEFKVYKYTSKILDNFKLKIDELFGTEGTDVVGRHEVEGPT